MKTQFLIPLLLLLVAIVALLIAKKLGLLKFGENPQWPFYVKKPLTPPEQVLYHRLVTALPEHIVLAQVQVSRVLGVKKGFKFHEWNNRVNRLSYDFVVCGKDSTVIAAIELDDRTHESESRTATDSKKNKATTDAGLKLVRWNVRDMPNHEVIRSTLVSSAKIEPVVTNTNHLGKGKSAA